MAVVGTEGNAQVNLFVERVDAWRVGDGSFLWEPYGHDVNADLIADFVRCVETGDPVPITGYDGLKAMEVALGAYRASEAGGPVALPLM